MAVSNLALGGRQFLLNTSLYHYFNQYGGISCLRLTYTKMQCFTCKFIKYKLIKIKNKG